MSLLSFDEQFVQPSLKEAMALRCHDAVSILQNLTTPPNGEPEPLTGWFDYPKHAGFELIDHIQDYQSGLEIDYDLVLVIGIGGSYVGCRAVCDAVNHTQFGHVPAVCSGNRPLIRFAGHHVCERELIEIIDLLSHKRPLVNIISKSGSTVEPGVTFRVIRQYMEKTFGIEGAKNRIVVTTDPENGALRDLALRHGYFCFQVPGDMGGRYSVMSAVGMLPLALGKIPVKGLMEGADLFFQEIKSLDEKMLRNHPVIRYPLFRQAAYDQNKGIELLAFSEPRLHHFAEWWKQLFGESEGKKGKGIFPASLSYTTDLHSLGQYVQDGSRNLIETFITFQQIAPSYESGYDKRMKIPFVDCDLDGLNYLGGRFVNEVNHAAVKASKLAHFQGGVSNVELQVKALEERSLGVLFAFFETACAVSAGLLGVNPFDQPGVESYKKHLFAILGRPGYETISDS